MTNSEKITFLLTLENLRICHTNHLNSIGSYAAYDLLLQLAIAFAKNDPITVKQIFISNHSYTAVRMYYKIFLKEDLIYLLNDSNDKRVKFIRPTPKFEAFINGYLNNFQLISPPENVSKLNPPPLRYPSFSNSTTDNESFNPNRNAKECE
jgi:DNA-binding MarR family transcriptional regulator